MKVAIREKGRVTLPAEVREAMALHEGDVFEVGLENGTIVLKPSRSVAVDDVRGIIGRSRVDLEEIEGSLGRDES
ncbi:MAG: AbrB/MazE/SpoVT family DNA-binding domain-containing protein [Nitrososphaerota archaeon]|nr:AbrB/MazE/SpoVT family DNA-binding domain-containing protein [Nitrososphaerota archaeon]MDG7020273.1 AbrB/MazE/SpoVT family DNA-binding domain-containing protein [Nitrososphaerota archaeon]MDG7028179.1 AbrB/MazE/SpoVT family DNA-binding domain-containing protein [Nitrososphaerota archaeon]